MKYFVILIFPLFLAMAGCRPAAAPVSVSNRPVSVNEIPTNIPIPPTKNIENMGWTKFDGARETISGMKGKVIVLDFWATYCPPCLEEIPHLVELQRRYAAEGVLIIGLHTGGTEDRPKVPAFVEKLKMNYVLAVPDEELTSALFRDNDAIPQTFVFDREGTFVEGFVGFDASIRSSLDQALLRALGN